MITGETGFYGFPTSGGDDVFGQRRADDGKTPCVVTAVQQLGAVTCARVFRRRRADSTILVHEFYDNNNI